MPQNAPQPLYLGTVVLCLMHTEKKKFDVLLLGDSAHLQEPLNWLMSRKLVEIDSSHHYALTKLGSEKAEEFIARYYRMLQYFDVFGFVDLEEGTFAFSQREEFQTRAEFDRFLDDDRWDDLRLAVAAHLGADPFEIVFSQFLAEGGFDYEKAAWELSLTGGVVWQQINEIIETAIMPEDLAYGEVSAEEVMADVIEQGFLLVRDLTGNDPEVCAHLARWAPAHHGDDISPDNSPRPFWKDRWDLPLPE